MSSLQLVNDTKQGYARNQHVTELCEVQPKGDWGTRTELNARAQGFSKDRGSMARPSVSDHEYHPDWKNIGRTVDQ
ncbi:hypothetical protein ANN_02838 [Periplaneta americana]|uniref:Uncharacterized protein n=1 Tax=Periplaneta americana TaxID=6978 RepID=A0ABQ8TXD3_PERAM|nr:hypothetical protein ANN_02838 [Periplaneta americana]